MPPVKEGTESLYTGMDFSDAKEYKDFRDSDEEKEFLHDERGRFKKGHKGIVPYSRKHMTRQAFLRLADDKLIESVPKIVEMVIKKAMAGNLYAAKLIFDRLIPIQRPSSGVRGYMGGIQIVVQGSSTDVKKTFDVDNNEEEIV